MTSNTQEAVDLRAAESSKGMREMCLNMLMEAEEKCEEIDVKCDEEYRALKFKEIVEQRGKVKKVLEKRQNDVNREFRVFMTKLTNQSRLALLKAKNDIVKQIMDEVKGKLSLEKGANYVKLLKRSMVQALYMMMEPEVKVLCKRREKDLVASCFRDVVVEYESVTLLHVKICVATEELPDKTVGGVIVCNMDDEVSVDCLLDSRVEQVCRLAMPLVVELLFANVQMTDVVRYSPNNANLRAVDSLLSSSKKSVSIIRPVEDGDTLLQRMARSPVPQREQGVHSSTIALPTRTPSTSSRSLSSSSQSPMSGYEAEPTTSQAPSGRRRDTSASMETATPSPQRTLKSASETPSTSPPQPPVKNDKNIPKPRK